MKRKVLSCSVLVAMLMLCVLAVACNSNDEHTHKYVWETKREATCTSRELQLGICECGHSVEKEVGETLEHSFGEWTLVRASTCSVVGIEARTCVCGEREERELALIDHTFRAWEVTLEPTCTANGIETRTCVCGASEQREIDMIDHTFGAWELTLEPSCDKYGVETRRCGCGEIEEREVAMLAHAYGDWKTTKKATCMELGVQKRFCECGAFESRDLPIADHNFAAWYTVNEPDCDSNGLEERKCICGKVEQNVLKAYGHKVVIDEGITPTEFEVGLTEGSHCGRCQAVLVAQKQVGKLTVQNVDIIKDLGFEGYTDGSLRFYWSEYEGFADRVFGFRVIISDGVNSETVNVYATQGYWDYQLPTKTKTTYSFTFYPISNDSVQGNAISKSIFYVPEIMQMDFPRLEVTTQRGELPTFTKTTPPSGAWGAGIIDANYVQSVVNLYDSENNLIYTSADQGFLGAKIKVRGNTSAYDPKSPFKIKLASRFDLLSTFVDREEGRDYTNKNWVLLRGGSNTNVAVGSTVSEVLDKEWTPAYTYVSLFINGDYRGLYVLIEALEPDETRCNVSDNGYIIEMDAYWWNEGFYFTTPISENSPAKFTFKAPDPELMTYDSPEYLYIKQYVTDFENVMLGNTEGSLSDYIDVRSFARWLLAHDILSSYDSGGSNMYMTKYDATENSKLCMGPVWDFDSIYWSANRFQIDQFARIHEGGFFYMYYLWNNPEFRDVYIEEYERVRGDVVFEVRKTLAEYDTDTYRQLCIYEAERWGRSYELTSTVNPKIISWFEDHLSWMDVAIYY